MSLLLAVTVWPPPRTVSLTVNRLVEIERFGGILSVAVAVPEAQRRVTGNPVTNGLMLNVHVWADRTFAVAVTSPP